ncbi:hypothetical protein [Actinomadura sp. HBU206391]|uniref:hypothetical protein n=1 Tax=Actinomadura sp. HBU206391 TaxID=2731692 RepID=UPI00164F28DC|nr:hypothetical protein [Actinomadura sp. HBU206391]MBC6456400.1 hypothetical protein [Actinomadura sp. HBU206391]
MQLIEVTELAGVRSAVIVMKRRGSPMRFVLFPMLHVGEQHFYEAVAARVRSCQIVVTEGVIGDSSRADAITRIYRWIRFSRRHDLVVQDVDYDALGVPSVRPDMTAAEFDRRWGEIPLRARLLIYFLVPLFALYLLMFSDRRFLARHLELDLELSDAELSTSELIDAMEEVIVDQRDRLLMRALVSIHEERHTEPIDVAVVWGAGHMRAVVRGLKALGYQPCGTDWLTVFRF